MRLAIPLLLMFCAACSQEWYRHDADVQVQKIIQERKQETLGYQPDSQITEAVVSEPTTRAYAMIPQSPLPPPAVSPMEPVDQKLPRVPLGPRLESTGIIPDTKNVANPFGVAVAEKEEQDSLVLGPPDPKYRPVHFDLYQSLGYAVQHSRDYQDHAEVLYANVLNVTLQRHLFEPSPFATEALNFTGGQRDTDYQSALAAVTTVGVTQNLPYGGTLTAEALVTFVNALDNQTQAGETAQIVLSGSIPLLRGAGMINLEPLIQSERQLVYSVRRYEDYRRSFAVQIATAYFSIRRAQEAIDDNRRNYEDLAGLTERTQALYDKGRINYLEVQRAFQEQLFAENSLIDAQQDYQTQLDQFKILLGMDVRQDLEIVPVDLNVVQPKIDSEDSIALALKYRLDLVNARDAIDDARRQVSIAENGLLPDLNLTMQTQLGNEPLTPASKINERSNTYSAGLTLGLPLDRLAQRNAYRQALIGVDQTERAYVDAEQGVIADVRATVRAIHAAQSAIQIQRLNIQLAQQRLEYANELLLQGQQSSRDVVEAQQSLLDAENTYEQARADLQTDNLQFLEKTGTLRVDPTAGSLGRAMDRAMVAAPSGLEARYHPGDLSDPRQ